MIAIHEAREYCIKQKCGHCLTHNPPTCCNYMMNIFVKENGIDWCKKNIKYFDDFYKSIPDDENILLTKNTEKKVKKEKYEYTLLDLLD